MKKVFLVLFSLLCTVVNATPYVTNVVAKQRYPWNGLVDVSYEVVGSTNGLDFAYGYLEAIDQKTQKTYPASTFTKPIDLTEGMHTATWNMAADYDVTSEAMIFRVSIKTPSLYRIIDVSEGAAATSYPVLEMEAIPDDGWGNEYKVDKIVLRRIDRTNVVYYAGIFEVTQAQWDKVMGGTSTSANPERALSYNVIRGNADTYNWPTTTEVDATSFIGKLRQKTRLVTLDLPSNDEWEFAARAGVTTSWPCGDTEAGLAEYAWYYGNDGSVHEVGLKKPNAWGLYDVLGNVWEWCLNSWSSDSSLFRVLCGGAWDSAASDCTFYRWAHKDYPSNGWCNDWGRHGFRLFCRPESD